MSGPTPAKRNFSEQSRNARKRRKELEDLTLREWGAYDLQFTTFGKVGIEEQQKFIQRIDRNARWAVTRSQIVNDLASDHCKSVLSLFSHLHCAALEEDIITVHNSESLETLLQEPFKKPLIFQSIHSRSIGCGHISWDSFWRFLQNRPGKMIDVFDYSIDEPNQRTQRRTVQQVIEHWQRPLASRTALNCLDIENRLAHCCPLSIVEADLLERTLQQIETTLGKTESNWRTSHQEFLLASTANAVSNIHVDTGGRLTYLNVLHGRKIIYFPRRLNINAARLLAKIGSEYSGGYGGWARVELRPGDLLSVIIIENEPG